MSKLFCTLAWYHDGGTLKPQLLISSTPGTNIVMKGTDWKGSRFKNMNATVGSRDRIEYSFSGGRHVTRASLVMNTSVILPPMIWLSNHPAGAPTKKGPRGDPKWKALEEAKRVHEAKRKCVDYIPHEDPEVRIKDRHRERKKQERKEREEKCSQSEDEKDEKPGRRRQMLEASPPNRESFPSRSRRQFTNLENRSYDFTDEVLQAKRQSIPDAETRRRDRQRRLRASSSPLPARPYYDSPPPEYKYVEPEPEGRRPQRYYPIRSESEPGARLRRSNRHRYRSKLRGSDGREDGDQFDGDGDGAGD
ncbi:hypothetical protein BJ878DRAFT_480749 [Calycina marina]|uniref:Uncharacterized protein n=1 Tax=Calycina marina TaxID=1763456 RepID=A0A9P8CFX0_9HELO|nr:hypothetical protein BJ878DRAFT_480749 [Calycina marina]